MTCYFQYSDDQLIALKSKDVTLAGIIDCLGHVNRVVEPTLFQSVIRHIIAQQISSRAVDTIWRRLVESCNGKVDLDHMILLSVDQLQALGMTYRKAGYIVDFVLRVHHGDIHLEKLYTMDDQQVIDELIKLKGIGVWTAQMILLHGMNRMDVFAYDDLAIHRGLRMVYQLPAISKSQFEIYRKRFSPYGSLASIYLWKVSAGAIEGLLDPARER